MASDLFVRKMNRLFRSLDVSGDGYLDKTDFDQVIGAMVAASNGGDAEGFKAETDAFWQEIALMDGDGDSRITPVEFAAAMEKGLHHEDRFEELMGPLAELWFDLYDRDGDGAIEFSEYEKGLSAHRPPMGDLRQGFEKMDADGDGMVKKDHWIGLLKEFCLSDDLEAPGNWILGPPDHWENP